MSNQRCTGCRRLVRSVSVTAGSDDLTINIPRMTLSNSERLCLLPIQDIPESISPLPVVITVGTSSKYRLIDRGGNYIYSDQIWKGAIIPLSFASDSELFVHQGYCLRRSSTSYPSVLGEVAK